MKNLVLLFYLFTLSFSLTNCATICGGSKYYAHILVSGKPHTEITYKGTTMGNGNAVFKVARKEANRFSFSVKEKDCEAQTFNYHTRTFRGWAFAGTILGWTGAINGVPLPWGMIVDLSTGAVWKPNVHEAGVSKSNFKNFQYVVNYTGCDLNDSSKKISNVDMLVDIVYLKDGSIIRGTIIEDEPTSHIKLQTADGSIFVFKIEAIEKITRE